MTQQPPAPPDQPEQQDKADQPEQQELPKEDQLPPQEELPDQPVAAPPPPLPTPPKAPPKKRRVGLIVALTVAGALAVVAIGGFVLVSLLREELPQVGDCMSDGATAEDMEVVACDSPEAAWNVIGSDGDWTWADFNAAGEGDVCQDFAATNQALWVTSATRVNDGTEGEVVCLAPIGAGDGSSTEP